MNQEKQQNAEKSNAGSVRVDADVRPLQGERELTFDERVRWGECPVCGAKNGEYCYADIGFQLGRKANSQQMQDGEGAHMGRLQKAPFKAKLVAA